MVILAVDLGKARTGLAICDKSEMLASPLGMIENKNLDRVAEKIAEYAKERKVEMLIVGLPKIWTAPKVKVPKTPELLHSS